MERDYFMTAEEAKKFGLVDHIVERRPVEEAKDGKEDEGKKSD